MSCLFDSYSKRITGKFIVIWIDVPESQSISEEDELGSSNSQTIVPEYVFAVGHDSNYIIAKQHPTNGFKGGYKIDTSITNYFIIDMKRIPKFGNYVPTYLSRNKFDSLRSILNIKHIKFDMNYSDLP
jgi:hypothetical protein